VSDPVALRRGMVEELTSSGELDSGWREAFLAVPRHTFIPDLLWRQQRGDLVPFRRADDPEGWLQRKLKSDMVTRSISCIVMSWA